MHRRENLDQAASAQIRDEVQARFIDQPFTGNRPATDDIRVIAYSIAGHADGLVAAGEGEEPALVDLLAPDVAQAVVMPEIVHFTWRPRTFQIGRCGA